MVLEELHHHISSQGKLRLDCQLLLAQPSSVLPQALQPHATVAAQPTIFLIVYLIACCLVVDVLTVFHLPTIKIDCSMGVLKVYSRDEVANLIDQGHLLVIFNGEVLKMDKWVNYHPGGRLPIEHMVGKEARDPLSVYGPYEMRTR